MFDLFANKNINDWFILSLKVRKRKLLEMFVFLSFVKFTMSSSEQNNVIRASDLNLSVETLLKISSSTSKQHRYIWKRFCFSHLCSTKPTSFSLQRVANSDLVAPWTATDPNTAYWMWVRRWRTQLKISRLRSRPNRDGHHNNNPDDLLEVIVIFSRYDMSRF